MRALAIAATGMDAQQTNLEVIANNIANINTTGFKRARAEFTDLLYQTERAKGVSNRANQAIVPEGANIGLGVQTSAVRNLHHPGRTVADRQRPRRGTRRPRLLPDPGTGRHDALYAAPARSTRTRRARSSPSTVILSSPNITIPTGSTELTISRSGEVTAKLPGADRLPRLSASLQIADFVNEAGLQPLGDNLFQQTPASGDPVVGTPDEEGFGYLKQGYLESSNVDPVKEITELISAQRAYEMNSKVITTADEMASIVSKNLK